MAVFFFLNHAYQANVLPLKSMLFCVIVFYVIGNMFCIEQGISTVGGCRYRQAIPLGQGGRLDLDTNFGIRRGFLPQV